jgi:Zn-finger nucleic acid-binding protein
MPTKCPDCNAEVWDVAKVGQALNKCWECGLRWMNDTEEEGS